MSLLNLWYPPLPPVPKNVSLVHNMMEMNNYPKRREVFSPEELAERRRILKTLSLRNNACTNA